MDLKINEFENINYFFGNVLDKMKNKTLSFLLENNRDIALKTLELMLKELEAKSNVHELINDFKKKHASNYNRFFSLMSEIRAAYHIVNRGYPVKFIKNRNSKTPDIISEINGTTAYFEVKRINEKPLEWRNVEKELRKHIKDYDIYYGSHKKIISASQFAMNLNKNIPDSIPNEFDLEDPIFFENGYFFVRKKRNNNSSFSPRTWWSIRQTKEEALQHGDAYYSLDEIEGTIKNHLEKAVLQLKNISEKSNFRFVFLDDIDVPNYGHQYLQQFLYDGRKNTSQNGWYYYNELSEYIDGIFYHLSYDFSISDAFCFLNPNGKNYLKLKEIVHQEKLINQNKHKDISH